MADEKIKLNAAQKAAKRRKRSRKSSREYLGRDTPAQATAQSRKKRKKYKNIHQKGSLMRKGRQKKRNKKYLK